MASDHLITQIILEHIEDGIFFINHEGLIGLFNKGAEEIVGQAGIEVLHKDWQLALVFVDQHGQELPESNNPLLQAITKQTVVRQHDAFLLTTDKRIVPIHIIVSPLVNRRHNLRGVVGVMRQMSAEKQAEAAKTDFVSTASHEMRTPLASLEGYLSLIAAHNKQPDLYDYVQQAYKNVRHLSKLFGNLLTTSQSEDGQLSHRPEIFDLGQLLPEVVKEHRPTAIDKKISLEFKNNVSDTEMLLEADPARIEELFNNLLDNALKYTDQAGKVILETQDLDQNFWQIRIKDSGSGISRQDSPHIFQKFYRIDNQQPGTGLGLFICKKIVELYQGDIWLESLVGEGSTFFVNLPKMNEDQSS